MEWTECKRYDDDGEGDDDDPGRSATCADGERDV